MRSLKYLQSQPWVTSYDGEGTPPTPPVTPPVTPPPAGDPPTGKTYNQEDLNKIMAEEKRKQNATVEKTVQELERLKKSKELTDKQRDDLSTRIEELNNTLLTKEQLAIKEQERLRNEHKAAVTNLEAQRDRWQGLYTSSTIATKITDESVKSEAFAPQQLVALLQPNTRLTEDVDTEGNPTGSFTPKVKFQDVDKEGKPVVLDLTIVEAVKRMKELPEYGNLFKSGVAGGVGVKPDRGAGRGGEVDPSTMSPEQYRKWRMSQPRYSGAPTLRPK